MGSSCVRIVLDAELEAADSIERHSPLCRLVPAAPGGDGFESDSPETWEKENAMADSKTVLVSGATGQQGGAVARELLAHGYRVRAMTRKPESGPARSLGKLGAELVEGDLDDEASVARAVAGAWGTFAVQNTWEAGVEKEEIQGKRFAKAAREAGVQHFVYSSVGSAHRKNGGLRAGPHRGSPEIQYGLRVDARVVRPRQLQRRHRRHVPGIGHRADDAT
jgi:hypothetical protein